MVKKRSDPALGRSEFAQILGGSRISCLVPGSEVVKRLPSAASGENDESDRTLAEIIGGMRRCFRVRNVHGQ